MKYYFSFYILFIFFLFQRAAAQQDSVFIKQLLDTAFQYERSDYDKSKKAAQQALELSKKTGFGKGTSQAYRQLGLLHYDKSEYDKAVDLFLKALDLAEKNNFHDEKAKVYLHLGLVYLDKSDFEKALTYFKDGKKICEQYGFKKGLPYYTTNIAIVLDLQGKFDEAIGYFEEALQIMYERKDILGQANVENNIGNVYKHERKYPLAKEHYLKALSLLKGLEDIYIAVTYGNAAEVDAEMQNYPEALKYLDSAITSAKQFDSPKIIRNGYEKKAILYKKMNDYKSAFEYSSRARSIQDTIFSKESEESIAEMQTKYETEKKESENRLLKQENELNELKIEENRKKTLYLFGGLALALLLLAVSFYAYRIKIKTNKILEQQNERINNQNEVLKKLNTQLIESEESLQFSNASKDKLLSVISHDVSNPVKALANYSQAVLNDAQKMEKDEIVKAFTQVNNAVIPLQNMVENLLNWSYIQKNGLKVNKSGINLYALVNDCVFIYKHPAAEKNIFIESNVPENIVVNADPDMMSLIVRNLISNAVKFSGPGDVIKIVYDNAGHTLSVIDKGHGMDGESCEAVLKGISSGSLRGTGDEKGTGMGLQLTRDCILAQGFGWNITSSIGEGTTVEIVM